MIPSTIGMLFSRVITVMMPEWQMLSQVLSARHGGSFPCTSVEKSGRE
jgi:hypothetical protein